jgi:hypothetical protein
VCRKILPEGLGIKCEEYFNLLGGFISKLLLDNHPNEQELEFLKQNISEILSVHPIFYHYFIRMMERIYPNRASKDHNCDSIIYIDENQEKFCESTIMIAVKQEFGIKLCTCPLLTLICQFSLKSPNKIYTEEVSSKLLQYNRYRELV